MTEKDEGFKRLRQSLAHDQEQQVGKSGQIEEVRVQLAQIAQKAITRYRRAVEVERPQAEATVGQTIQPWFLELKGSGSYADLLKWSKSHGRSINLSDAITYYWPEDALEPKRASSYRDKAKFVVEQYRGSKLPQGIETHADSDEVWYAGFELEVSNRGASEEIKIWRQPVVGMGFGFAMVSGSYAIPMDAENVAASFDRIAPEVWIKFGQQIESGRVWKNIEQSMKPAVTRIASVTETQRRREEDWEVARQYLKNRKW